jgi:hypothetical protein
MIKQKKEGCFITPALLEKSLKILDEFAPWMQRHLSVLHLTFP